MSWRDDITFFGLTRGQADAWLGRLSEYHARRAVYYAERSQYHGRRAGRCFIAAAAVEACVSLPNGVSHRL